MEKGRVAERKGRKRKGERELKEEQKEQDQRETNREKEPVWKCESGLEDLKIKGPHYFYNCVSSHTVVVHPLNPAHLKRLQQHTTLHQGFLHLYLVQ